MRWIASLCAAVLVSCAATPAAVVTPSIAATPTPTASATPARTATATATPVPTPTLSPGVRMLGGLPGGTVASPDGKWIASSPTSSTGTGYPLTIFDNEGALVRTIQVPSFPWTWLPDSSGLFVALDAPQRAPKLGIVDVAAGNPRDTGLQLSNMRLARDGRSIVAEHQDGCCVAIETKELWVAPREGGTAKTLVRTKTAEQQPIQLLGLDDKDRVIYRDGPAISRIAIAGGSPQQLGTVTDWQNVVAGTTSPDGIVTLMRLTNPLRWSAIANDQVRDWSAANGEIVTRFQPVTERAPADAVWYVEHSVLVKLAGGGLASVNAATGSQTALGATLETTDAVLALQGNRLLLLRESLGAIVVIDIASGQLRDTGIRAQLSGALLGVARAAGGFVLSTENGTYRID